MVKLKIVIGLTVWCFSATAFAFPNVTLNRVAGTALQGPVHHGLVLETSGIDNANVTSYEISIKPSDPQADWITYSEHTKPLGKKITLPYRNGFYALTGPQSLCVRIRAIYGENVSRWSEQCGIRVVLPPAPTHDQDNDGIPDDREYEMGLDPRNTDTDTDNNPDGQEQTEGSDPRVADYPHLILRTASINFGEGDPFGRHPNQHQTILIENTGDAPAHLNSIIARDTGSSNPSEVFKIGSFHRLLSHLPLQNRLYLPVSFLPKASGVATGEIVITSDNNHTPLNPVILQGTGVGITNCSVEVFDQGTSTPTDTIDFGTVNLTATGVLKRDVRIVNPNNSNQDPQLAFTLLTDDVEFAPTIRAFVLENGEEIIIPIVFVHRTVGNHDATLTLQSAACGIKEIHLRGQVVP